MKNVKELCWDLKGPGACVIIELPSAGEDYYSYFGIAQDSQLLGLFQQSVSPLREGNLPACGIVDPPNNDLSSPHP